MTRNRNSSNGGNGHGDKKKAEDLAKELKAGKRLARRTLREDRSALERDQSGGGGTKPGDTST